MGPCRYETWQEAAAPPSYLSRCCVMGSSYQSKEPHGNKKAAEQAAALVALEALQVEAIECDAASVVGATSATAPRRPVWLGF